jgi:hypothetical protein
MLDDLTRADDTEAWISLSYPIAALKICSDMLMSHDQKLMKRFECTT